jgi:hypothetical protein
VTKEKLNLLEFTSSTVTEAGACATKIVGRETVNADSLGILFHRVPDYVARNSSILPSPTLRNSCEYFAFSHSWVAEPDIYQAFTPTRHRYGSQSATLPNHIDDDPMTFSQLQLIESQVHGFRAPQTAPEQQSDQRRISPATQGAFRNGIQ